MNLIIMNIKIIIFIYIILKHKFGSILSDKYADDELTSTPVTTIKVLGFYNLNMFS